MPRSATILVTLALALAAGCGHVAAPQEQPSTTAPAGPQPQGATTTIAVPVTAATPGRPAATTTTTTRPPATTSTTRPAATTTTTRPLSRAEATSGLCQAVEAADAAINQGRLVAGGLKLSSGIGSHEKVADPSVVTAARSMLRAGLAGDAEGYVDAAAAASAACTRAGAPIVLTSGIRCVKAPCP